MKHTKLHQSDLSPVFENLWVIYLMCLWLLGLSTNWGTLLISVCGLSRDRGRRGLGSRHTVPLMLKRLLFYA